ncbi:uncharacterized protein LOC105021618 [Esox lucius]|uniref:uncharacterized protein LOC105021618 n=1 Tax=Esox lucius TaxID=8010 RepID=UPI0014773E87|nr:uncharacterized protein LOC105021618 [Esox lucius]
MCLPQLGVLWLFVAVRLTTAEQVTVHTSDSVRVSCLQSVTLHCNITSQEELQIKHLSWFNADIPDSTLCEVNPQTGEIEPPNPQNPQNPQNLHRRVQCTYTPSSQLTLTLFPVRPHDQGTYTCKLRSTKGIKVSTTRVELQECYREAFASFNDLGPTCVFTGVYPDGDVHWFQGTNNLTGDAQNNTKQEEVGGARTVTSSLKIGNEGGAYNCSLWIPSTGVYLTSRDIGCVEESSFRSKSIAGCGVAAFGPVWTLYFFFLFLHSIVSSV